MGRFLKSEVRQMARELNIPENIINKIPSAGLWPGQTDEDEMGITYEELDRIILGIEKKDESGLDPKLVDKVKQRMKETEHKLRIPPCCE